MLVGNGPIRRSDTSGAVFTRRRSLHIGKAVAAKDERKLLDPDAVLARYKRTAYRLAGAAGHPPTGQ